MRLHLILLIFIFSTAQGLLRQQFIKETLLPKDKDDNLRKPLYLTPYIESGMFDEALRLSKVEGLPTNVESYSGLLTVDKQHNSNMFFWYFPSQNADPRDPVVLWLQGGPGGSSLFGLFIENGPFVIDHNLQLHERQFPWNKKYNLLFIDNPVGTGFSQTEEGGYSTDQQDIANNLYTALLQFFELFSDLKGNPFYITGESYAGKYVPALAYHMHTQAPPHKINLAGVAIGDGFTDPPGMIHGYADFLLKIGLFDSRQHHFFQTQVELCSTFMKNKQWTEAMHVFDMLLNGDMISVPSFFTNTTGSTDYYNYLNTHEPDNYSYYATYLNQPHIRNTIHVGSLPYNNGKDVERHLINDFMQSALNYLTPVMDHYKVLIYSGQLDIIVALPLTETMVEGMDWKGKEEFKKAKRVVWKVDGEDREVAGYAKQVGNFSYVTIRSAGHIAPYDQPKRCWDMIDRFIQGKAFH